LLNLNNSKFSRHFAERTPLREEGKALNNMVKALA
jgi:hypothetical protein